MKYWDYHNYEGSLEDTLKHLLDSGKTITNVTILQYSSTRIEELKELTVFATRALILYF